METSRRVVSVDVYALSDHLSRLYELDTDGVYRHIDIGGASVRFLTRGTKTDRVELTDDAVKEFIADMEYQVEFSEGEYRSQSRRGLRQVRSIAVSQGGE